MTLCNANNNDDCFRSPFLDTPHASHVKYTPRATHTQPPLHFPFMLLRGKGLASRLVTKGGLQRPPLLSLSSSGTLSSSSSSASPTFATAATAARQPQQQQQHLQRQHLARPQSSTPSPRAAVFSSLRLAAAPLATLATGGGVGSGGETSTSPGAAQLFPTNFVVPASWKKRHVSASAFSSSVGVVVGGEGRGGGYFLGGLFSGQLSSTSPAPSPPSLLRTARALVAPAPPALFHGFTGRVLERG
jgi:hypothetical protein